MNVASDLVLVLALGFAGGFIAGRRTAPGTPPSTFKQTALFDGPTELGALEVCYPHPSARPLELTIVEEKRDPSRLLSGVV